MTQDPPIAFDAAELAEIARYPRLDLTVDFTQYTWLLEEDVPTFRVLLEHRSKPEFPQALFAFLDSRAINARAERCPRLLVHFSRTQNIVAIAVHFDHDEGKTNVYLLDEEAMIGRLCAARYWHTPEISQLLALVKRFGLRILPGLLRFASDPGKELRTAAAVLSKFDVPDVAPVMARAFATTKLAAIVTPWLERNRALATPILIDALKGSLAALAWLDRSAPLALDADVGAIVRAPHVAELVASALGERRKRAGSGVDLGERIDLEGESSDPRFLFGEPRRIFRDADASAVERADMQRLFENLGDGFPEGSSIESFLKKNWAEVEGITIRSIEDLASGQRFVAYLHLLGENLAGYVVRDDATREVVLEVSESGFVDAPSEGDTWPRSATALQR